MLPLCVSNLVVFLEISGLLGRLVCPFAAGSHEGGRGRERSLCALLCLLPSLRCVRLDVCRAQWGPAASAARFGLRRFAVRPVPSLPVHCFSLLSCAVGLAHSDSGEGSTRQPRRRACPCGLGVSHPPPPRLCAGLLRGQSDERTAQHRPSKGRRERTRRCTHHG
jgi:hypothetical protein